MFAAPLHLENRKVLIVDDDDAIRAMIESVLRREQFEVDSARDGFEAIEKLSRNDYSAILLDLMMPRLDGHGVLQYLEAERNVARPCVIVMTANLPGALETKKRRPVAHILAKPFDIRQLIAHVRTVMGLAPRTPRLGDPTTS